jgi:hypothetical protein
MRVLIAVKTYPVPSKKYKEIVCTAGVREDGVWVRIFPVPFRQKDAKEQYKKYQWIEFDAIKSKNDPRPESFSPTGEIIPKEIIDTAKNWQERKKYIRAGGTSTMCSLDKTQQKTKSLGIIKPKEVLDFWWEKTSDKWDSGKEAILLQGDLFDEKLIKPLEKIPYLFRYKFTCHEPGCKGHDKMIEDWEVMQLFRSMRDKHGEEAGLVKVKQKFLGEICGMEKDTHFITGTMLKNGRWTLIGTFWPKKENSTPSLF